jgi:hypothetical protein
MSHKKKNRKLQRNDENINNYEKPELTYQEKLTKNDIYKKLEGYEQVDNIANVNLNTHVRYFIKDGENFLFRMGGFLVNKSNPDLYVILAATSGKPRWSVQVESAVFFRKLSFKEQNEALVKNYEKKMKKKNEKIIGLKSDIDRLQTQLSYYINKYGSII